MDQPLTMLQIDAFTAVPFAGNPAGVCFLDRERPSFLDAICGSRDEPV